MTNAQALTDARVRAFLSTIANAEGTGDSYNIIYGFSRFSDYSRHPNRLITAGGYSSTAAGRYQFLYRTWENLRQSLGLPDFGQRSQDLGAAELLRRCGALARILNNDFQGAVAAARGTWPSLPGGTQQRRTWAQATAFYNQALQSAGGFVAPVINVAPVASTSALQLPAWNLATSFQLPTVQPQMTTAANTPGQKKEEDSGIGTAVVALIGFLVLRKFFF